MAEAIDTKKTISIVNSFAVATGEFLNHFCAKAHKRISQVNRQIERLEALTQLLEYKVNSFPADFASLPAAVKAEASRTDKQQQIQDIEPPKPVIDEEYKPYVRMLNVGVPRQAVKHKIAADGKDPNRIDELVPPTDD
jgi:Subunit CCDC53 of WASH complex